MMDNFLLDLNFSLTIFLYSAGGIKNDIALIKVTPPFKLNDKVQKVTLPEPGFEPASKLSSIFWISIFARSYKKIQGFLLSFI